MPKSQSTAEKYHLGDAENAGMERGSEKCDNKNMASVEDKRTNP